MLIRAYIASLFVAVSHGAQCISILIISYMLHNNDAFRQLLQEPRWCSVSKRFAFNAVSSSPANMRKLAYSLWRSLQCTFYIGLRGWHRTNVESSYGTKVKSRPTVVLAIQKSVNRLSEARYNKNWIALDRFVTGQQSPYVTANRTSHLQETGCTKKVKGKGRCSS